MITVLTGDNSFEIHQRILDIKKSATSEVESIDGENLTTDRLPSLLMGATLFSQSRCIILKQVSANSAVWSKLSDYIDNVDDQTDLILVEPNLDKRTKTYKQLQKSATIHTYTEWTYKDESKAIIWVTKIAESLGLKPSRAESKYLIDRVGYDQWRLKNALDKLSLVGSMPKNMVDTIIEGDVHENIFQLLETALSGRVSTVLDMTNSLEKTEDPYKVFGLLFSQLFQLVALSNAPSTDDVIKDLKLHPYAAKKQAQLAIKTSRHKLNQTVRLFADSDEAIRFARPDTVWAELTSLLVAICKA